VHIFYTNIINGSDITLEHGTLTETMSCSQMECIFQSYNELTCAADDPCGWAGNGECNEHCLDVLPPGVPMFDDSTDC
jgi:hypothetical protein